MMFEIAQRMPGSIVDYVAHAPSKEMAVWESQANTRPQKYLRCWGNDYPYLKGQKQKEARWLPIPENSEAQCLIRNLNRVFRLK